MPIHNYKTTVTFDYYYDDYNHNNDDDDNNNDSKNQCVMHDERTETETEKRERQRELVRSYSEPIQLQRITSGLTTNLVILYTCHQTRSLFNLLNQS